MNIDYPVKPVVNKENIFYVTVPSLKKGDKNVFVRKPRYINPVEFTFNRITYRVISEHPTYAISEYGSVLDIFDFTDIKEVIPTYGEYILVSIAVGHTRKTVSKLLHRLVALAWVDNTDWAAKYFVNHLNGNKHDPHKSNLEWTNYSSNVLHAVMNGLRNDNIEVRARNIYTDEIVNAKSLTQLAKLIDVSLPEISKHLKDNRKDIALSNCWELRKVNDLSDWRLTPDNVIPSSARYIYRYTYNGQCYRKTSLKEVYTHLGLFMLPGYRVDMYINHIRELLGVNVKYEKIRNTRISCLTYTHSTKTYRSFDSFKDAAKFHNVSDVTIGNLYTKGPEFVSSDISVKADDGTKWPTEFLPNHLEGTNVKVTCDGTVVVYKSINETSKNIGINRKAISSYINTGEKYKGYLFER